MRKPAILFVVLGVIVLALGAMLVIYLTQGGEGDHVDIQNGEVVTGFLP